MKLYRQIRDDEFPDVCGFLAAYVADKYVLGQSETAFDLVYAAYRPRRPGLAGRRQLAQRQALHLGAAQVPAQDRLSLGI